MHLFPSGGEAAAVLLLSLVPLLPSEYRPFLPPSLLSPELHLTWPSHTAPEGESGLVLGSQEQFQRHMNHNGVRFQKTPVAGNQN